LESSSWKKIQSIAFEIPLAAIQAVYRSTNEPNASVRLLCLGLGLVYVSAAVALLDSDSALLRSEVF
jgi:hypothetical protein